MNSKKRLMSQITLLQILLLGMSTELKAQTPSVDGGHFCVVSNEAYVAGQNLIKLDLSTGKVVKTILRNRLIQIGPIIEANSLVYSVGGSYSTLAALDRRSYVSRWKSDHRSSLLAHHDGKIFLNNQLDDSLEAINASTGRRLWTSRSIHSSGFGFSFAFIAGEGRIVTNSGILSETTGSILKSWPGRILDASSSQGRVWILDDRGLVSELDPMNKLQWESSPGDGLKDVKRVFAEGDLVFVVEGPKNAAVTLTAISQSTHQVVWSHPAHADSYGGSVAISKGLVITVAQVDKGTTVTAYDAKSGVLEWQSKLQTRAESPTIVNGLILLKSAEGLYALQPKDGALRWKFDEGISANQRER